ncbi:MAG: cytochrome c [Burkholderiales bacterium]|jgi:mono/diheme cytochrome c family protein|nr:cytochrome c [Burkholderiales bacterium]
MTAWSRLAAAASAAAFYLCALPAVAQTAPDDLGKRGEYLARLGDCMACHTKPGGTPWAGGFRVATPFGDLLSPNITPDVATGIGTWSADDFYRALHDGVAKGVGDMYPAMPYTFYTKVTRADSDAIYAYLRTLQPVANKVEVNQLRWPFDIRLSMGFWRELFFTEGTYKPDPAWGPEWNRGAYLVEGLGHCSACHSPRNFMGAVEKDRAFTGATVDGWFAPNLTENWKSGLGDWSIDQIVAYLKTGAAKKKSTTFGDMATVQHNSMAFATDADLRAMATYLKTLAAKTSAQNFGAAQPVPPSAAKLYMDNCGGCHRAKGAGLPGVFPPLAGNGAVVAPDPINVIHAVLAGLPPRNGYVPMPGFAAQLTDAQIAEIANYVRSSWGNTTAPNATAAMVRNERAKLKTVAAK